MSYFKEFCESTHKTKAGYVPDLLDLESDDLRDIAMASWLADNVSADTASRYHVSGREYKNDIYSHFEANCQDAIDAYNQTIDDAREADSDMELLRDEAWIGICDPDYKWQRFNQTEIDAGFSGTGREFC